MDDILSLLDDQDAEYSIDTPLSFNTRESYVLKYQIHDPDTPTYMEDLSGEHADENYKAMDDKIKIIIIRDIWEIISRKSVDNHNVFPGTQYFK